MRSDNVKSGVQQAPHRSLFNALGFTEEEMKKPMVGIVSSYNESGGRSSHFPAYLQSGYR